MLYASGWYLAYTRHSVDACRKQRKRYQALLHYDDVLCRKEGEHEAGKQSPPPREGKKGQIEDQIESWLGRAQESSRREEGRARLRLGVDLID